MGLLGTVAMLLFGYLGESMVMEAWLAFFLGLPGWGFILYEIFAGEASKSAAEVESASKYVQNSFKTMRLIVSAGWCIYPAGYFFGYLLGAANMSSLNLLYNLADFVNKIAFCLAIWHAAKQDTLDNPAVLSG